MIIALLALLLSVPTMQAPAVRTGGSSASGSQPVSAVAVATWLTHGTPDGHVLDLIVIWRGEPGWYLRGNGNRSSGSSSSTARYAQFSYGGVEQSVRLLLPSRTAEIGRAVVDLGEANVVLVDSVDSPAGPMVIKTLRVDPAAAAAAARRPPFEAFLRRSAEIIEFLSCDTRASDPAAAAIGERLCALVLGPPETPR